MNKKIFKFVQAEIKKEERVVNQTVSQFNEVRQEGIYTPETQAVWKANLEEWVNENSIKKEEDVMKAHSFCVDIIYNVRAEKEKNLEINFIQKLQKYQGKEYPLGVVVTKVVEYNKNEPAYIYVDPNNNPKAAIYISCDMGKAYMIYSNVDGKEEIIRLAECHLLSMSPYSTPGKEVALMTSYTWLPGEIYTSVIAGGNLIPIKNLLLVDSLPRRPILDEKNKENSNDAKQTAAPRE